MPIDLTAVAARFTAAFALQLRGAAMAQLAITPGLAKRRTVAGLVERATRQYPVFRFEGDAVTLRLAPGQAFDSLAPPPSLGTQLAQGGLAFLHGIADATAPFREDSQETAIPRFLVAAERALAEIEAAVIRWSKPTAEMFDPDRATASDLFGLAALGFRAVGEAARPRGALAPFLGQLKAAAKALTPPAEQGGAAAVAAANSAAVASTSPPGAPTGAAVAPTLTQTLDEAAQLLAGGLLGAIAGPALLAAVLNETAAILRATAVDTLAEVERTMFDLRRTAFETVFTGLSRFAERGSALVLGAHGVIAANISFQFRFAQAFVTALTAGVGGFLTALGGFLVGVVRLLEAVPGMLSAFTAFNLTRLWQSVLGDVIGKVVDFSLDDLLDADGRRPNLALWSVLDDAILRARVVTLGLSDTLANAQKLVDALFGHKSKGYRTPELIESAPFTFHSAFPNAIGELFADGRGQQIAGFADRLQHGVRGGFKGVLDSTGEALTGLAGEFAADTGRAARLSANGPLTDIAAQSARLADAVFGAEVTAARPAPGSPAPLAESLESWLAGGGFALLGEAIPAYVGELAAYWEAQLTESTELTDPVLPTSPHILRRRAVLGEVGVRRVVLHVAPGRELDEALTEAVADGFAAAVRSAYRTGLKDLAAQAGTGGR